MNNVKLHWSFWVIGVAALLWNAMGSMNYIMQMNPETLAKYPDAARSLIAGRPAWATAAFAVAVFGGLLGDIFLLLRKAVAFHLFMASFLGVLITNIHTIQVTGAAEIWVGSLMSLAIAAFLIGYTKVARQKGWMK